jgi:DNA-binding beta-propeller fold protein YncE
MTAKYISSVVLTILLAGVAGRVGLGQPASRPSSQIRQQQLSPFAGDGPVAIAMRNDAEAAVLQLKGRVSSFNAQRWIPGGTIYSVPRGFDATDLAATSKGDICLLLNGQSLTERGSFVLQVTAGQEVWISLRERGVYTGLAIDQTRGFAYAANSTTNTVSRLRLGQEKQAVARVVTLYDAERIGAIAIDPVTQRLFIGDSDGHRIFVRDLNTGRTASVRADSLSEIRAMTWDARRGRLYVADSGSEGIWSVDPQGGGPPLLLVRDNRFRQPSGLTLVSPDLLAVSDETTGAIWSLSVPDRAVRQTVTLSAAAKK